MYGIVLIRYRQPIEEILKVQEPHRAYLRQLKADGVLLAAGPLAALRSAALSGAAALSALAGRIHRARALGRLAYPLLSVCAVKFLIEDFWRSGPVMLFVALACFGVALIVTARSGARA